MNVQKEKSLSEVHETIQIPEQRGRFRTLLAFIGPAYLVSVGYMDPGNWATDIAGGSQFGYKLLWILLMSNLVALLLQSLAARLGIVTGWDLAQASRQQYPGWANISLYVLAEIAIAACDLAEVIGMAIGLNLLFGLPMIFGVLITILDTLLLLFLINKGIRTLEIFILSLVGIIGISFIAQMLIVKPELAGIASGLIPSQLSDNALYIAIGIIGATVMPHNLYLHSSLVQTRRFEKTERGLKSAIKFNVIDSAIALNAAFFVNASILILAAAAFYRFGYNYVSEIQDAYKLLYGLFGNLAPTLFAIALIAAGQSSTITGTLAGQIVMEGYLNLRISPWLRRLMTRLIAIIPALITLWYFGERKLGDLLILSQVVLSVQLGFAVIPLIHFNANKSLMKSFAIKGWVKIAAWLSAAVILGLNIRLVYEQVVQLLTGLGADTWGIKLLVILVLAYALILLAYILFHPMISGIREKQIIPHANVSTLRLDGHKYNHVGISVDFSKNDQAAIQHALSIGGREAKYMLIHIVESAAARRFGREVMDTEARKDQEYIESYLNDLEAGAYKVHYKLGYGNRAKAIPEIVENAGLDLLVMGAHGHKGLLDFILGSTVDEVRHRLKIPVLVVRS